jgi:hypothetical protein
LRHITAAFATLLIHEAEVAVELEATTVGSREEVAAMTTMIALREAALCDVAMVVVDANQAVVAEADAVRMVVAQDDDDINNLFNDDDNLDADDNRQ